MCECGSRGDLSGPRFSLQPRVDCVSNILLGLRLGQLTGADDFAPYWQKLDSRPVHADRACGEECGPGPSKRVKEMARLSANQPQDVVDETGREALFILEPSVAVLFLVRLKTDERPVQVAIDMKLLLISGGQRPFEFADRLKGCHD